MIILLLLFMCSSCFYVVFFCLSYFMFQYRSFSFRLVDLLFLVVKTIIPEAHGRLQHRRPRADLAHRPGGSPRGILFTTIIIIIIIVTILLYYLVILCLNGFFLYFYFIPSSASPWRSRYRRSPTCCSSPRRLTMFSTYC